ncbi:type II secretion system F family protein [Bacillus sp. DJP31]|uniref:type II secretion system F family protein n=1 Tax=Bacillus sp. DJP31 TaxID=3409789 RepID=UPI003BB79C5D
MPRFKYQGRATSGKVDGLVTSPSKREAMMKLREQGIRVFDIQEVKETLLTRELTIGNPVKLQHFVIYLRQFATLLKAGISVVDATKILSQQSASKVLKRVLLDVEEDLRSGQALSQSSSKHKKVFTPMFINMVRAGEASGSLDETLERLAEHYEKQHYTKQKIISALAYPVVVGIIAVVVVIFLLVQVVPTFVSMFAGFNAELPLITRLVLDASEFMQKFWWIIIIVGILSYATLQVLKQQKSSRYYLDYLQLKIPVFGPMFQKAAIARMTRTLSSLFTSSVPILQALSIVEDVVENEVIARVINESKDSLERGVSLTEPMKKHWAFPPLVTQMIAIGEETGSLDAMLGKIADFYEKEVESSTDRLKSLIEPIMIVVLASIVGTIVTAIIVPMFDIFNKIN